MSEENIHPKRFIITGENNISVEQYQLPPLGDQEILVRNEYTAVSIGTEIFDYMHWMRDGMKPNKPIPTGYSCAGVVLKTGSCITDIQPGDRVCGQGIHSSHCVLQKPYQRLPEHVSSQEAALVILAAVALHGIRKSHIALGNSVVILGVGIIGQMALTFAKLSGAFPVIAVDINSSKLEIARKRGADYCINPAEYPNYIDYIKKQTLNGGADIIIEATGLPSVYPETLRLACIAGKIVSLGSPRGTVEMNFLPELHKKELSIIGAFQPLTPTEDIAYYHWNKQNDRDLIVRLLSSGILSFKNLITKTAHPGECQSVYQMLAARDNDHLGVLFNWGLEDTDTKA